MNSQSTLMKSPISSFRDNHITVRDAATGAQRTLLIACEEDGTLIVADTEASGPELLERRKLTCYPTEEAIMGEVSSILGSKQILISVEAQSIELDKSALAGLKKMPVDIFDNVYLGEVKESALVLCVDIRNFSNFLCCNEEGEVFRLIKDFTSNLLSCVNQFGFGCSYYKLMGDGAIVIWDVADEDTVTSALGVFDSYISFVNEELFKGHEGLGMAGALVVDKVFKYEISAEASQLKYRDYVGYGINLACRLQGLAIKDQLVINQNLATTGFVPFRHRDSPEGLKELRAMKGLKEEDRAHILLYTAEN